MDTSIPSQDQTLHSQPNPAFNPKALDILLKYLEQILKNVDTSILLAFTMVAFLLIPGLEGTFAIASREAAMAEIPYLNFKAELLTAAIFGLVLYWVFCFRAASQVSQARKIANQLKSAHSDVLEAALHFPSIATATIAAKWFTCVSLALLGIISWVLIYLSPFGLEDALWGSFGMVIPPAYLLYKMAKPLNVPIGER